MPNGMDGTHPEGPAGPWLLTDRQHTAVGSIALPRPQCRHPPPQTAAQVGEIPQHEPDVRPPTRPDVLCASLPLTLGRPRCLSNSSPTPARQSPVPSLEEPGTHPPLPTPAYIPDTPTGGKKWQPWLRAGSALPLTSAPRTVVPAALTRPCCRQRNCCGGPRLRQRPHKA